MSKRSKISHPFSLTESLLLVLLILFGLLLIRTAWVGDDAYISYRTIDNFVHGYGLNWNINERVQSFTHPLWVLFLSIFYFFFQEIYAIVLILSIIISVITVYLLAKRVALSSYHAMAAILIAISSKSFVEYSTSGLENPMTHLLIVLYAILYLKKGWDLKTVIWLNVIASLIALNRMDVMLLLLPAIAYSVFQLKQPKLMIKSLIGFSPFLLWEIFSMVYYGFPFPNTYYAKLYTGIRTMDYIFQGAGYFVNSLNVDPVTLLTVGIGCTFAVMVNKQQGERSLIPLVIGIVLYLGYILKIGGDFMSGRFFSAPFLIGLLLLVRIKIPFYQQSRFIFVGIALLLVGLITQSNQWFTDASYINRKFDSNGVADERGFYFEHTGLINLQRNKGMPLGQYRKIDREVKETQYDRYGCVGMGGYFSGPNIHIIDEFALCDPLLARMPILDPRAWRIGHFTRVIPNGYQDTLDTGVNHIYNKNIAEYYNQLSQVVRGDIWSWDRFVAIWNLNTGAYDSLISYEAIYEGEPLEINYEDINTPQVVGTSWNADGVFTLFQHGIRVLFSSKRSETELELSLDNNNRFELTYFLEGKEVGSQFIKSKARPQGGLVIEKTTVPPSVLRTGFDTMMIKSADTDVMNSVGHVRLLP